MEKNDIIEIMSKIKIVVIEQNEVFKILRATGQKGDTLAPHISDKVACVVLEKGTISFDYNNDKGDFKAGDTINIAENVPHSIEVLEACEFLLILDATAKLRFIR